MEGLEIRLAEKSDEEAILNLYHSAIGTEGCTWNTYYPSEIEIENDTDAECLYVGIKNDEIIGAASIVPVNEYDEENFWHISDGHQREIARITVLPEYRGKGYAVKLVRHIIAKLEKMNCTSVHLLVAKGNDAAIYLYKGLGFEFVGECHMYGNDYYACEKSLYTLHHMKLNNSPFNKIKSGEKIYELRLNDEKRQKIHISDEIIFTNAFDENETIRCKVLGLTYFESFEELYDSLDLLKCGYTKENIKSAKADDMNKYYDIDEQRKYGVVAIEIKLIDT